MAWVDGNARKTQNNTHHTSHLSPQLQPSIAAMLCHYNYYKKIIKFFYYVITIATFMSIFM